MLQLLCSILRVAFTSQFLLILVSARKTSPGISPLADYDRHLIKFKAKVFKCGTEPLIIYALHVYMRFCDRAICFRRENAESMRSH